jgi:transcriptional regulator with XRE-family HTH domain
MEKPSNYFCKNLQYLRKEKRLRQHEMQTKLGFSRTTWSNYEKGKTSPSLDGLVKISRFFGITIDELVAEDMEQKFENRKYKPYPSYNNRVSVVEESNGAWEYISSRLDKLELDVDHLKAVLEDQHS